MQIIHRAVRLRKVEHLRTECDLQSRWRWNVATQCSVEWKLVDHGEHVPRPGPRQPDASWAHLADCGPRVANRCFGVGRFYETRRGISIAARVLVDGRRKLHDRVAAEPGGRRHTLHHRVYDEEV